jgi:EAL domain-containing protein (putative c-di-GMP-specific phosphodiesterase class I)
MSVNVSAPQLWELKGLGVRLAIDDFGTGFSSLSYLRRLPVDTLKIDKSFVDDLGSDRGAELARALVDLAAILGLDTVAEGIEHHEQAEILHAHGCRLGQGYVFSRPLPAAAIETLLKTCSGGSGRGRRSGVVLGRCAPVTLG